MSGHYPAGCTQELFDRDTDQVRSRSAQPDCGHIGPVVAYTPYGASMCRECFDEWKAEEKRVRLREGLRP